MSSKKSNNFIIQEDFQQILSNFTKAILFYKPKDTIDFAIKYFISLEKKIPLKQILEEDKYINILKTESTMNNEQKLAEQDNIYLDNTNSKDFLEINDTNEPTKKIPLTKGLRDFIKNREAEYKKQKSDDTEDNSAYIEERKKVKQFISELFEEWIK